MADKPSGFFLNKWNFNGSGFLEVLGKNGKCGLNGCLVFGEKRNHFCGSD
tara:strand:- start:203 stop:352 length:150 start_codon:yes stop_codon:yes gene_type:complete